jgi:hypothetical protein
MNIQILKENYINDKEIYKPRSFVKKFLETKIKFLFAYNDFLLIISLTKFGRARDAL